MKNIQCVMSKSKSYLQDQHETPLAFYFQRLKLLSKVRANETNAEMYTFTDDTFRELSNQGNIIRLDDMKRMIEGEFSSYNAYIKDTIFFGEDIPDGLMPSFEIEDLIDNMQNHSTGYSFIDDHRNKFAQYRSSYGRWLLSDSQRAQKYAFSHDGKLYWKPSGAFELLDKFQHLRSLLIVPLLARVRVMGYFSFLGAGLDVGFGPRDGQGWAGMGRVGQGWVGRDGQGWAGMGGSMEKMGSNIHLVRYCGDLGSPCDC